jgi:acyl-coenzyme A thioesterase 13
MRKAAGQHQVLPAAPARRRGLPNSFSTSASTGADESPVNAQPSASSGADERRQSFIDRVKTAGADIMLGAFLSTGYKFDRTLEGMTVMRVENGLVVCELVVAEGLQNAYGSLHGGATCTIVDVVGTMALLSVDPTRAGVSVDLNVTFLAAAKAGERITVEARVLRSGKRLGFTEVEIFKAGAAAGDARVLVATGRHTKAL